MPDTYQTAREAEADRRRMKDLLGALGAWDRPLVEKVLDLSQAILKWCSHAAIEARKKQTAMRCCV